MMPPHNLRIMTWNANSITNKKIELQHFLSVNNLDVAAITETKLSPTRKFSIPNYTVYRSDRNQHGGGVLLLVKNGIKHDSYYLPEMTNLETVAVCLYVNNGSKLLFVSCYKPPDKSLLHTDLHKIFRCCDNVVIAGDLNCKHTIWNCSTADRDGRNLLTYCQRYNVVINYPDSPTYHHTDHQPSVLDLALSKHCPLSHPLSVPALSSDHNPVVFKIRFHPILQESRICYDFKRANWHQFRSVLDGKIVINPKVPDRIALEHHVRHLTKTIQAAAVQSIPVITTRRNHLRFPATLQLLTRLKNYLRRKSQRHRNNFYSTLHTFTARLLQQALNDFANSKWRTFLGQLHPNKRAFWKISRYFTKPTSTMPPLIHNNQQVFRMEEKVNVLANHFKSTHYLTTNLGPKAHTRRVTDTVKNAFPELSPKFTDAPLTSPGELRQILKKMKSNSAPGFDSIHPLLLRNLSRKALIHLTILFNHMLMFGYFPTCWKAAKAVPIPKPGKPATNPASYRCISLLPTLSKLFERVVARRLKKFVSSHQLLPHTQFGFRERHSTVHQLARITDFITHGFNLNKYTGMVSLDLEKAYDTVWINGLLYKLINYHLPLYLLYFPRSYLTNRSFQVTQNQVTSLPISPPAGLPQGAVLSTTLFSLYLADIPQLPNIVLAQYADDTGLLTQSWRTDTVANRLSRGIHTLKRYFARWKLRLNGLKTEACLFTKRRPPDPPCVVSDHTDIPWQPTLRYLGVELDAKLTFTAHVHSKTLAATRLLFNLFPLLAKDSTISLRNKLTLFKLTYRPSLTYACPMWSNTCETNIKSLQVAQNKCLRVIGNFPRATPIHILHQTLNILPMQEYIHNLTSTFFTKCISHSNPLIKEIGNYTLTELTHTYKKYKHKRIKHLLL